MCSLRAGHERPRTYFLAKVRTLRGRRASAPPNTQHQLAYVVQRIIAEAQAGLHPIVPTLVERDVELTSISGRGRIPGGAVLVRAEIAVNGGPPPDGRPVRYLQLMHMLSGQWMVTGESDSYQYFTQLMPAF